MLYVLFKDKSKFCSHMFSCSCHQSIAGHYNIIELSRCMVTMKTALLKNELN